MAIKSVLILSHCGFSFAEDLIMAIRSRGMRALVLSSQPLPEHGEKRLEKLRELAAAVLSTESHVLGIEEAEDAIASLRADGYDIRACISVWEGYRSIMAAINAQLGVGDLQVPKVNLLRDKLAVRNELNAAGLSRVVAQALTPASLVELQQDGGQYFVKPASGIASYGAFRLTPDITWSRLESIVRLAKEDVIYSSIIGEHVRFIAEDYIAGIEFSFEVLASEGTPHVIAVHEKCELTEANGTVLEDSCTSPPVSLAARDLTAGLEWLERVFAHLGIDWGCFHVEARFDGMDWDLIEINPRVGGSLISHSVRALNGEASLLDLWIGLLLEQTDRKQFPEQSDVFRRLSYDTSGTPPTDDATFFRVYFAAPGQIESIAVRAGRYKPVIEQILLKPGEMVPDTPREVFLGQLLWLMPRAQRDAALEDLLRESANSIELLYRTPPLVLETQS